MGYLFDVTLLHSDSVVGFCSGRGDISPVGASFMRRGLILRHRPEINSVYPEEQFQRHFKAVQSIDWGALFVL